MKKNLLGALLLTSSIAQAAITTNVVHMGQQVVNTENVEVFVTHEGRVFEVDPSNTTSKTKGFSQCFILVVVGVIN